jgi:hypothetical protein
VSEEAFLKLFEVMKSNKSVESLTFYILGRGGVRRESLFANIASSGGWSSIQELIFDSEEINGFGSLSLREAEHISSFILQSRNLSTLKLENTGVESAPIVETLSRTNIQSLQIRVNEECTLQNGGRRIAAALERCTGITELELGCSSYYSDQVELFRILLVESIPKMLGLKKFELEISRHSDQQLFDMVGQCIGGHQGVIEELRLTYHIASVNSSLAGLAPALRRLKVVRFDGNAPLTLQEMSELSGIAADFDFLEEFGCNLVFLSKQMPTEDFKAICQLLSKFPSLKRLTRDSWMSIYAGDLLDLSEESRFMAFLEMIKTSKTIEQVPPFQSCHNAEEEASIRHHCHNNMMRNRFEVFQEDLLAATVPSSAWPLILHEFSDIPDVLYCLLQQKHSAMIGPTLHGCKRKQDFDEGV